MQGSLSAPLKPHPTQRKQTNQHSNHQKRGNHRELLDHGSLLGFQDAGAPPKVNNHQPTNGSTILRNLHNRGFFQFKDLLLSLQKLQSLEAPLKAAWPCKPCIFVCAQARALFLFRVPMSPTFCQAQNKSAFDGFVLVCASFAMPMDKARSETRQMFCSQLGDMDWAIWLRSTFCYCKVAICITTLLKEQQDHKITMIPTTQPNCRHTDWYATG